MATTSYREDYLGRDLIAPTSAVTDYMGLVATSTVDAMGRTLRRIVRSNGMTYTLAQEVQFTGGSKYVVKTAGTAAGSPPSVPSVGADVTDGTAVLTRTK